MASHKYTSDYQLPTLENQEYLFRERFFHQEILPYEEERPRQVYIIYSLYSLIIFINYFIETNQVSCSKLSIFEDREYLSKIV